MSLINQPFLIGQLNFVFALNFDIISFATGIVNCIFDNAVYFLVGADVIVQAFVAFDINNAFVKVSS